MFNGNVCKVSILILLIKHIVITTIPPKKIMGPYKFWKITAPNTAKQNNDVAIQIPKNKVLEKLAEEILTHSGKCEAES